MGQSIADFAAELGIELDKTSFDDAREALNDLGTNVMNDVINSANEMAKEVTQSINRMAFEASKTALSLAKDVGYVAPAQKEAAKTAHEEAKGHEHAAKAAHEHGESMHTLGHFIAAFIGLHALHTLEGWAHHAIAAGAAIGDLADKTGTSVEEIQELGYAAKIHGLSTEFMASTLGKLATNLDKAAKKGGEAAEPFRKAGIAIKDASGKARPAADVMGDIADRLQSLSEEERPAEAVKLLGKAGRELIPFLKNGKEGIDKLRQEARDLGLVMSGETVEAMDKVEKNTKRLGLAWEGLKEHAIATLLPSISELVEEMLKWVKMHHVEITEALHGAFKLVVGVMKVLLVVMKASIKVIAFMAKHWQLMIILLGSLAIAYYALNAAALVAAAGELLALLPVIAIAAAIAALILIVEDLYMAFTGGESVFKDLYEIVKEWLVEKVGELMDTWVGDLIRYYQMVFEAVKVIVGTVYDEIKTIVELIQQVYDIYKEVKGSVLGGGGFDIFSGGDNEDPNARVGGFLPKFDTNQFVPSTPQVSVPGSSENANMPVQATANVQNTFNINGGDPEQIKKVVSDENAKNARLLEAVLGGAMKAK